VSNDFRMQAKFDSECPRCQDWIITGQFIVQDDSGPWVHAVCPRDLQRRIKQEPCEKYIMRVVDGKVVQTLETK
jgi:hypothetical protein